jgi:hypothetical protein
MTGSNTVAVSRVLDDVVALPMVAAVRHVLDAPRLMDSASRSADVAVPPVLRFIADRTRDQLASFNRDLELLMTCGVPSADLRSLFSVGFHASRSGAESLHAVLATCRAIIGVAAPEAMVVRRLAMSTCHDGDTPFPVVTATVTVMVEGGVRSAFIVVSDLQRGVTTVVRDRVGRTEPGGRVDVLVAVDTAELPSATTALASSPSLIAGLSAAIAVTEDFGSTDVVLNDRCAVTHRFIEPCVTHLRSSLLARCVWWHPPVRGD